MNIFNQSKILNILFFLSILLITFSSIVYLYESREKIKSVLPNISNASSQYDLSAEDIFWAKEILNGGYILHFRHAEREKWIDVQMYDSIESDLHENGENESRYAENDYFHKAVCLNERGLVQAKAIGESISHIGLPIGLRVSSVSCRSRQTAELSFGGYDSLHRLLVHKGPYNEKYMDRMSELKKFYKELPIYPQTNTIVSAHNGVVGCKMFINASCGLDLEEGGFYIISQKDDGLYLEHEFHYYNNFHRVFFER